MNKLLLVAALAGLSFGAQAQVCDVVYVVDTDVVLPAGGDPVNVGTIVSQVWGLPLADAEDNTKLGKKIINESSKQQDKGGPYVGTYSEVRSCDGGAPVRVDGIFVKGMTLKGSNAVARVALKVADEVIKRHEKRADKGDKYAHDHGKAHKIKRGQDGKREREKIVAGD